MTYTSKGSKWVDDDAEIKIGYIQIPVLARYRFASEDARFRPYVMFGPAFAFKAGCTLIVSGSEYECSDETTAVAGTDFGLMFGAGAELGRAQFSIRYDRGLKNINGDGPANVKNQVIKIAVGYCFRLGREFRRVSGRHPSARSAGLLRAVSRGRGVRTAGVG